MTNSPRPPASARISLAFLFFALIAPVVAAGCDEAEAEPPGWHAPCDTGQSCAAGLQCLPNPQSGTTPTTPPQVCTSTCSTDDDCPVPNDRRCHERFPCIGRVCGGNWGCR